jgi:hypothetical protein
MHKRLRRGLFALAIAAASACAARADAILTLTPSNLDIVASKTVEFDGTLTNTGTTDLYLNGDVVIFDYAGLTIDDSIFYVDAPLFLSAGDSYTGAFFNVTADAATLSRSYSGTYTIQGGADSDTFDDLAMANFTVDVGSSTPEPNSMLLMATGLAILAVLRLRQSTMLHRLRPR